MKLYTIAGDGPTCCALFDGTRYVARHVPDDMTAMLAAAPALLATLKRIVSDADALNAAEIREIARPVIDSAEGR